MKHESTVIKVSATPNTDTSEDINIEELECDVPHGCFNTGFGLCSCIHWQQNI